MSSAAAAPVHRRLLLGVLLALGSGTGAVLLMLEGTGQRDRQAQLDQALLAHARTLAGALAPVMDSGNASLLEDGLAFFGMYADDGTLLLHHGRLADNALPPSHATLTTPHYFNLQLPDGRQGRAVAVPVQLPGTGLGTAVLIGERSGPTAALPLPWVLLASSVVLLLVALLASAHALIGLRPGPGRGLPRPGRAAGGMEPLCDPLDLHALLRRTLGPQAPIQPDASAWVIADAALLRAVLAACTPAEKGLSCMLSTHADGLWLAIEGAGHPLPPWIAPLAQAQGLRLVITTRPRRQLRLGPFTPL
ncbi:hypothetical protein [Stenotrophomonas sp. 24(2023)]|uniref:hypothetical protein n=1 Tax=Stenotrophomonas sp. 24(2023) TaxID=3068324 RepID=UPI0027E15C86|nr:hypothetical protein [Stenotrophomonas sp. 24(2023)]WMJ69322.1 hypothetical protein Q9R17_19430 [Stenotrophomonas sp. 24(2023)]